MTKRAPATAATKALDALGIAYTPRPYEHDPAVAAYGEEAAQRLGVPRQRVFKTLVADAEGSCVVAVVPVSSMLDLKALAASIGAKRVALASPEVAERRTGYVLGGISPFGQRSHLPLVLDASAEHQPTILVSGGRRGFDLEVAPADLLRATGGTTAAIGVPR